jgi:hypothetical protein
MVGTDGRERGVYRAFREPLTVSVTPSPYLTSGSVNNAGTAPPAVRASFAWSDVPAESVMLLQVTQGSKVWTHIVTPQALGGATTAKVPDLSGVPGWNPSVEPLTGVSGSFSVKAAHGNKGVSETLHFANDFLPTLDGTEVTWVARGGTVTF